MTHFSLGHRLPYFLAKPLFGDRRRYGTVVDDSDPDWKYWIQHAYLDFYDQTQRGSIGEYVNQAGYEIMRAVNLDGANVLEIGPGLIRHLPYWSGRPACYTVADIMPEMLQRSRAVPAEHDVPFQEQVLIKNTPQLPFSDGMFDVIVSFYSLEHLCPMTPYISELVRVLRPGGQLVGAIPAEGGLAWGAGRFFTSRRWFKNHTHIDPDKIICWEHPNYADQILASLDSLLARRRLTYWPLTVPSIDLNLVIRFVYEKPGG